MDGLFQGRHQNCNIAVSSVSDLFLYINMIIYNAPPSTKYSLTGRIQKNKIYENLFYLATNYLSTKKTSRHTFAQYVVQSSCCSREKKIRFVNFLNKISN